MPTMRPPDTRTSATRPSPRSARVTTRSVTVRRRGLGGGEDHLGDCPVAHAPAAGRGPRSTAWGSSQAGPDRVAALASLMETSTRRPPPAGERDQTPEAGEQAADRVGHRVGAEHRVVRAGPGDQPAGHGGVVAEGDPVAARAAPAVTGDADPDPAFAPCQEPLRGQPELGEGAGRDDSTTTLAPSTKRCSTSRPSGVENDTWASRWPSWSCR